MKEKPIKHQPQIVRNSLLMVANLFLFFCLPLVVLLRLIYYLIGAPRISYWTGTPILTIVQKAASERLLGFKVLVVVRYSFFIERNFDIVLSDYCKRISWLIYPITCIAFFMMLVTAARVHTFADAGLLPGSRRFRFNGMELFAYRILRIPHFVWVYGADVRTRKKTLELGNPNLCLSCTKVGVACVCVEDEGKSNLYRLEKNGAVLFSMGDMIEYTPGSRNDLYFWPLDTKGKHQIERSSINSSGNLKVVHAPNHRDFKGTQYLIDAIQSLQDELVPIELILIEKKPNSEATKLYREADIIFDQCVGGFYGYFTLEAMALGKPVMAYIRKPQEYLLHPEECPIINTHIDTLKEDLRRMVIERDKLQAIGIEGRRYVERYFSREAFASRLGHAYKQLGVVK